MSKKYLNQNELLKFLKENPRNWFTTKQIAILTDSEQTNIISKIQKLRRFGMVKYRYVTEPYRCYLYRHKTKDLNIQ